MALHFLFFWNKLFLYVPAYRKMLASLFIESRPVFYNLIYYCEQPMVHDPACVHQVHPVGDEGPGSRLRHHEGHADTQTQAPR